MVRIVRREPFRDYVTLREAMDQFMGDNYRRPRWGWREEQESDQGYRLPLDAYMTAEEVVIVAAVPGLNPDEVEITTEGDTVTIKGELKQPMENVDYILQERPYGKFSRTLTFNIPVQTDKTEASFENGLLKLVVPKAESIKPKTIKVQAK
jgi:HSP20 family protein